MNSIISILMKRDNMQYEEAYHLVHSVQAEIMDVIAAESNMYVAYEVAADIVASELGLEPDYLEYLIL